MKRRIRWMLADKLSRIACWLREQKWYVAQNIAGVPGNEAAELKQRIWENCVILNMSAQDAQVLSEIETDIERLGQLAGENWAQGKR